MAGQIRITPEQMRSRANDYRTEANNVGQVISRMKNLLGALQSEWEGEASRSYAERYEQIEPHFVTAERLINEIADALNQTATTLEETDASIASGFRG